MAGAVAPLAQDLAQGVSLSAALEKWPQAFAPLSLAMIRTGELTGKLDFLLSSAGASAAGTAAAGGQSEKAVRYLAVILGLALMVVVAMLCLVLPEFAAIYQTFNTPLPLLTRPVIHASESLSYGWPMLILPIVLP